MKIALVYDRVIKFGGAERILLALHEIWPEAPLYTSVYHQNKASWAKVFHIVESFLKLIPLSSLYHEIFPFLTPYAFENFNFDKFDVVLIVTSSDAKSIITKPKTLSICYCLTPTRYLWSGFNDYLQEPGIGILNPLAKFGMRLFFPSLRRWDSISAQRPDHYLAISKTVMLRITTYYRQKSAVIYPPVDTEIFHVPKNKTKNSYFLIVSRLVPYKRLDYAISAFAKLNLKLKIIGSGIDKPRLLKMAAKNIEFIDGNLTDQKLCWYYQNCLALIFPGEEDFGLTAAEAQACGRPVIGLGIGGVKETIIDGKTGILYSDKTVESLTLAVKSFFKYRFDVSQCRTNSLKFSKNKFKKIMKRKIENLWRKQI